MGDLRSIFGIFIAVGLGFQILGLFWMPGAKEKLRKLKEERKKIIGDFQKEKEEKEEKEKWAWSNSDF